MATYTLQYPPAHNDTYVKATTTVTANYYPYFATDPSKSLTGTFLGNSWLASIPTNQRFHIDLGSARIIKRIYYENAHNSGNETTKGVQNFTFWGSNNAAAFAELTYGVDTNWTQLTTGQGTFDQHVAANQEDPKYILVTNSTAYRYYAFKIADSRGDVDYVGVRRIVLMTEDLPAGFFLFM